MNHDLNVRAIVALERISSALTGATAKTGHSPVELQFRAVEALERIADHFAPETKAREPEPPKEGEMPKELLAAINRAREAAGVPPLDSLGATADRSAVAVPARVGPPVVPPPAPPSFGSTSPLATTAGTPPAERRTQVPTTVGFQAPKPHVELPKSAADLGHMAPPTVPASANGTEKPQ